MKKFLLMVVMAMGAFILQGAVHANELFQEDGIFPNHSADYVRTLNRFASTDTDAAFYNPAGLAFMKKEGLHVEFSSQTMYFQRLSRWKYWGIGVEGFPFKLTENIINPQFQGPPKEYTAEGTAPCLPGFDAVWKGRDYAVYLSIGAMHAAPGLTFKDGLGLIDFGEMGLWETALANPAITPKQYKGYARNSRYTRDEYFIGGTVGAAYKIIEQLSAALGIRYIYATSVNTLSVKNPTHAISMGGMDMVTQGTPWLVKTGVKGHGIGIIAGVDIKPVDIITIGLKYEYYFPMDMKKSCSKMIAPAVAASSGQLNIFMDSWANFPFWMGGDLSAMDPRAFKNVKKTIRFQYPQTLSMGFSVNILENLRAETSGEISFRPYSDLNGKEKDWNLGYRVGQCLEWTIVPQIAVSVGYLYNDFGIKEEKRNAADPLLTSHSVGGGLKLFLNETIDVTAGFFYSMFTPAQVKPIDYTLIGAYSTHWKKENFDEKRWSVGLGITAHLFGRPAEGGEGKKAI